MVPVPDHSPAYCEICGHAVDDSQTRCTNLGRRLQSRREIPHVELVLSKEERHCIQAEVAVVEVRNRDVTRSQL